MFKKSLLVIFIGLLFILSSCTKDKDNSIQTLKVQESQLNFSQFSKGFTMIKSNGNTFYETNNIYSKGESIWQLEAGNDYRDSAVLGIGYLISFNNNLGEDTLRYIDKSGNTIWEKGPYHNLNILEIVNNNQDIMCLYSKDSIQHIIYIDNKGNLKFDKPIELASYMLTRYAIQLNDDRILLDKTKEEFVIINKNGDVVKDIIGTLKNIDFNGNLLATIGNEGVYVYDYDGKEVNHLSTDAYPTTYYEPLESNRLFISYQKDDGKVYLEEYNEKLEKQWTVGNFDEIKDVKAIGDYLTISVVENEKQYIYKYDKDHKELLKKEIPLATVQTVYMSENRLIYIHKIDNINKMLTFLDNQGNVLYETEQLIRILTITYNTTGLLYQYQLSSDSTTHLINIDFNGNVIFDEKTLTNGLATFLDNGKIFFLYPNNVFPYNNKEYAKIISKEGQVESERLAYSFEFKYVHNEPIYTVYLKDSEDKVLKMSIHSNALTLLNRHDSYVYQLYIYRTY